MKRRIAAALLVTLLPLGMAACGSQSKADACKEVQGAATKVVEDFSASSAALTDPQALKDQMAKTADTFREAAKKVSNKEVKDVLDPYVGVPGQAQGHGSRRRNERRHGILRRRERCLHEGERARLPVRHQQRPQQVTPLTSSGV